ncbi:NTP pyrophosphatase (non-canonical NTP hydrolase) [Bradyrhizobium sp. USDA 4509]
MSSTQAGFFDSLVTAVRENPLAAALIGGGAFWLLAGDEKLKSAARSATAAASPIVDLGVRNVRAAASELQRTAAPPTAPETDHDDATGFGETVREASSAASDAMSGAADEIKGRFDEGIAYARENLGMPGKEALTKAQSSLADVLDRQPLVLGAVGLAIGAAIAGAFRTFDLENEWVGELSDDIKADLNTRADAVSQSLREASDTLKAELGDVGTEAVDRLKQAGIDAADAAREKVKSP